MPIDSIGMVDYYLGLVKALSKDYFGDIRRRRLVGKRNIFYNKHGCDTALGGHGQSPEAGLRTMQIPP